MMKTPFLTLAATIILASCGPSPEKASLLENETEAIELGRFVKISCVSVDGLAYFLSQYDRGARPHPDRLFREEKLSYAGNVLATNFQTFAGESQVQFSLTWDDLQMVSGNEQQTLFTATIKDFVPIETDEDLSFGATIVLCRGNFSQHQRP